MRFCKKPPFGLSSLPEMSRKAGNGCRADETEDLQLQIPLADAIQQLRYEQKLDPRGKRPGFADVVTASEHLGELIGESRILLVIDDVWREAQLRPFLRGGPNCVRLVTTRLPSVLKAIRHTDVLIDEMRPDEAARLIAMNLPSAHEPGAATWLSKLADRLGN